jgi:hypothetical protein
MFPLFQRFIQERKYLKNVSPATIIWYEQSLAWLTVEQPTGEDLRNLVVRMREAGVRAILCNCHIRAINGYLHWAAARGSEQKVRSCLPALASCEADGRGIRTGQVFSKRGRAYSRVEASKQHCSVC